MEIPVRKMESDLVVVGGGMAGVCAAVAAARHGISVTLIQDRPVLGGNASSEIRMWVCGADGAENRESGLIEEIRLANLRANPNMTWSVWDNVLYSFVKAEKNIRLLLNTTVHGVVMEKEGGDRIRGIVAWGLSDYTEYRVSGKIFADCSGDGILRLSGAEYRSGRESLSEFGESHAPVKADRKTMGSSILIQLRRTKHHRPFTAPEWAYHFTDETFLRRDCVCGDYRRENFWWMEFGGVRDTIADADEIRHELLRIAFGVWEYIKNHDWKGASGWELDWIGALPGKRESVRYVGDHILVQKEIEEGGHFPDAVAHGGWSMDDHNPEAFFTREPPTTFHFAPSVYGIPYRSLYSRNIANLMFAGRNLSASHMGMSSIRVMATCATVGQAVGTAAAVAVRNGVDPRAVGTEKFDLLRRELLDGDQFLPGVARTPSAATLRAKTTHELLRNGFDRDFQGVVNGVRFQPGENTTLEFPAPEVFRSVRIVFDSDFSNWKAMRCYTADDGEDVREMPSVLARSYRVEVRSEGVWRTVAEEKANSRRLVRIALPEGTRGDAVRLVLLEAWGGGETGVFAFDVD